MDFRLPSGFLFEVKDSSNCVKGYLFGTDHRANERMLLSLKNEKIQSAFDSSIKLHVENVKKYESALGETKGPSFQAKVHYLRHSGTDFTKITNMTGGPLDSDLEINKPGVDFQMLADAFELQMPVDDMEGPDDSNQNLGLLDSKLLEKYRNNLFDYKPDDLYRLLTYSDVSLPLDSSEKDLVLARNDAWDKGNIKSFKAAMNTLGQNYDKGFIEANELFDEFTKNIILQRYEDYEIALCEFIRDRKNLNLSNNIAEDLKVIKEAAFVADNSEGDWMETVHENIKNSEVITLFEYFDKLKSIAFQRNRDMNLTNRVDQVLHSSSNPDFFLFGTNHLVSAHNFNFCSLLKEKGWTITQIK